MKEAVWKILVAKLMEFGRLEYTWENNVKIHED
jgi:hypothetical protein